MTSRQMMFLVMLVAPGCAGVGGLEIEERLLSRHVDYLAHPSLMGRRTRSLGAHRAAEYIARNFCCAGLEPAGTGGSYFQDFRSGFRNVVGRLTGSDPSLRREVIVIGAHYDHIGATSPTHIYNGADDNASGCAGLMEIARSLGRATRLPRTVVFVAFDAEEGTGGLEPMLGSKHFVTSWDQASAPIVTMVNLDMIGRWSRDSLNAFGARYSLILERVVKDSLAAVGMKVTWPRYDPCDVESDHQPFLESCIPVAFLGYFGHDDYHKVTDTADKVQAARVRQASRLAREIVRRVARLNTPPVLTTHPHCCEVRPPSAKQCVR